MTSIKNILEIPDNPEKLEISCDIFDNGAKNFVSKLISTNATHSLKQLAIRYIDLSDDKISSICHLLPRLNRLETLSLSGNSIGSKGGSIIASILKHPVPPLTSLDLFHNQIGNAATLILNNLYNSKLRYLGLTGNNITSNCAIDVKNYLKAQECTLQELCLEKNHFEDEGACIIAQGLSKNSTLRRLQLGSNGISDEGAIALANAIEMNTSLRAFSLGNNKITFEGCKAIIEASLDHPALLTVNLRKNILSDEEVEVLQNIIGGARKPRITIEPTIPPVTRTKKVFEVDEKSNDKLFERMNETQEAEVGFLTQMKRMNTELENEVEELIPKKEIEVSQSNSSNIELQKSSHEEVVDSLPAENDIEENQIENDKVLLEQLNTNVVCDNMIMDNTTDEIERMKQSDGYFELSGSLNHENAMNDIDDELKDLGFASEADIDFIINELNIEIENLETKLLEKRTLRDSLVQKYHSKQKIIESPMIQSPQAFQVLQSHSLTSQSHNFINDVVTSQSINSYQYNGAEMSPAHPISPMRVEIQTNEGAMKKSLFKPKNVINEKHSDDIVPLNEDVSKDDKENLVLNDELPTYVNENVKEQIDQQDDIVKESLIVETSHELVLTEEKANICEEEIIVDKKMDISDDKATPSDVSESIQIEPISSPIVDLTDNSENQIFVENAKIPLKVENNVVDSELSVETNVKEQNEPEISDNITKISSIEDKQPKIEELSIEKPKPLDISTKLHSDNSVPVSSPVSEVLSPNIISTSPISPSDTASPFVGAHIDEGKEIRKVRYAIKHPLLSDTNKMKIFCDLVYKTAVTETNVFYEHLFIDIFEREEGWFGSNTQKELIEQFSITNKATVKKNDNGKYLNLQTWNPETGKKNKIYVLSISKPNEFNEIYDSINSKIEEMIELFPKKKKGKKTKGKSTKKTETIPEEETNSKLEFNNTQKSPIQIKTEEKESIKKEKTIDIQTPKQNVDSTVEQSNMSETVQDSASVGGKLQVHKPIVKSKLSNFVSYSDYQNDVKPENEEILETEKDKSFKAISTLGLLGLVEETPSSTFKDLSMKFQSPVSDQSSDNSPIPNSDGSKSNIDIESMNLGTHFDQLESAVPSPNIPVPEPPNQNIKKQRRPIQMYLATHDYSNPDENYVSFKKGDILQCIGEKRGWMICVDAISRKKMLAPATYLQKL
eukprot:TRINITY_DN3120_c0_g3_i1.p1 TRINITY_DN3120_c0_g3~~TRINITY_DN3120_c0_g3_i1.p1  ORF type:complete len:1191 (+),score=456.31 TRINITY_DN3120_c0_g3_i1:26-3574(+)